MIINTKYGKGTIRNDGYIQITTKPNVGKLLHRLVYEEHFGSIPEGFCVHHINGMKNDNRPSNLILLSKSHHHSLHMKGTNHPRWDNGLIDKAGGLTFLSAEKNKGKNMSMVSDELGYSSSSSVFHYLNKRGLRWNQL